MDMSGDAPNVIGAISGQEASGERMIPLYKAWPGRSHFFCDGRCLTGVPSTAFLLSWGLILVPSIVYLVFGFRFVWDRAHPVVSLATLALLFLVLSFLVATSCTDPGIIPRRDLILACGSREAVSELLGSDVLGVAEPTGAQADETCMVSDDDRDRGFRWCRTCRIVRPPGASHCSDCDQCVLRFDHHCPYVNNCVGQRNYPFFFGFLGSLSLLAVMVIASLVWWATCSGDGCAGLSKRNSTETSESLSGWVAVVAIVVASLVGLVALGLLALLCYHGFLVMTRQTTREHLKGQGATRHERSVDFFLARGPPLFEPRHPVPRKLEQKPRTSASDFFLRFV